MEWQTLQQFFPIHRYDVLPKHPKPGGEAAKYESLNVFYFTRCFRSHFCERHSVIVSVAGLFLDCLSDSFLGGFVPHGFDECVISFPDLVEFLSEVLTILLGNGQLFDIYIFFGQS